MSSKPTSQPPSAPARTEHLEALERGLRVLAIFGSNGIHQFTMAEVADRLEITRASALRILGTLESLGYVHASGRNFRLGVRVLDLGYAYLSSLGFADVAKPIVESLVEDTGETSSIGVLDEQDVVYVVRTEARRIVRIDLSVGSRLPAYLNSMGRLLLGALPDEALDAYLEALQPTAITSKTVTDKVELKRRIVATRRAGFCYIDGEVEARVAGLSVPLRDREEHPVAALNITVMNQARSRREVEQDLLPRLRIAAAEIETILRNGLKPAGSG
jgi:IclR family transcriptional regulator, pca regulon regulatory protein